jgi:hypothetical protein
MTLLRTLWYLRGEQIRGQLAPRLPGAGAQLKRGGPAPRLAFAKPIEGFLGAPAHVHCDGIEHLEMIHKTADFRAGIDWEFAEHGPLWRYHLHQFDWLRSVRLTPVQRYAVIDDWISQHRRGTGWDGGPISLRTFAWLKLMATSGALPEDAASRERMLGSLADQLTTLSANLETRLLGNHYLWNLLALVFAGVLLESEDADAWRAHDGPLREQLDEQFPDDGAHFERSPMYHALLLENVLDLIRALEAVPQRAPDGLLSVLRDKAGRMLTALDVFTHPDGQIALFADSAFGIAPLPAQLRTSAASLGISPHVNSETGVLRNAGYARLEDGPIVLIASGGPPSPSYQPGHAHGDALSFEMSVAGERVVTDTGVCEYVAGPKRDWARSTYSHASVVVNGAEQAEFWSAHRVGGRPDAALTSVVPEAAATMVCAGYATPDVLHKRVFNLFDGNVEIQDSFDLPAEHAEFRLPLAPGLSVELDGHRARIPVSGGVLHLELPEVASWGTEERPAYPEFGLETPRLILVGDAVDVTEAEWKFSFEPGEGTDPNWR